MSAIAVVLIAATALLHVSFLVMEMFLWRSPYGRRAFGTTPEEAETMATLAANQGLDTGSSRRGWHGAWWRRSRRHSRSASSSLVR